MIDLVEDLRDVLEESLGFIRTSHERCPDGLHWNEDKRRCMKVTGALKMYTSHAHKKSAEAKDKPSVETHSMAQAHHMGASDELRKKGFHELADEHDKKAKEHNDQSNAHATIRRARLKAAEPK
jgi:hypothetical protein